LHEERYTRFFWNVLVFMMGVLGSPKLYPGNYQRALLFTSQHGVVEVDTLPVIASGRPGSPEDGPPASTSPASASPPVPDAAATQTTDMFVTLERLAELKHKGILSEEEFTAKKAELLRRI
jgi:hypothetical protein